MWFLLVLFNISLTFKCVYNVGACEQLNTIIIIVIIIAAEKERKQWKLNRKPKRMKLI